MSTFSIKYQTAEIISPPYSYAVEINGNIEQNQELFLSFELTYLNRDGLSVDEIEEEGFTQNDDFNWKGTLPVIWTDILFGNFKSSKPLIVNNLEDEKDFWELSFENKSWFPHDPDDWKYFIEEIQQAIFEKTGLEAPLNLTFLKINQNQKNELNISASFVHREIILTKWSSETNQKKEKQLEWDELNFILKNAFSGDFYEESALNKTPFRNGNYVNIGDGLWYEIGKSLKIESHKVNKIWKLFE